MSARKGTTSPSMPDEANASRISAKPDTPVWWVMRIPRPALRNNGQLCIAAWLRVRDPWLPPVISRWSRGPRTLGWMRKNSSRTGSPVTSVRPLGKKAAVSGKETRARATRPLCQDDPQRHRIRNDAGLCRGIYDSREEGRVCTQPAADRRDLALRKRGADLAFGSD